MTDQILKGRIALVTGATRGIGQAIALGLAQAGAHVIACGRTQGALENLDDEIFAATGEHATLVPIDLRQPEGVDPLGGVIYERWGKLDILVGAAGVLGALTPVTHLDPKAWDHIMTVNLTANWRLIRSMDALLRASDAGRAVFLSSGVAQNWRAFWGGYAASKAGLEAIVGCYDDEMENTTVRAISVNPGAMRTRMRAGAFPGEDPMSLPAPEEIVPLMIELVRPDRNPPRGKVISFREWKSDGGRLS
jgi:NAD(P)-dependent dehydrogenase (short-subunit alcohol dehydrogenase family)